ncbi:MAG: hypothetical protein AB1453_10475 [Chloroflexota bacterium]
MNFAEVTLRKDPGLDPADFTDWLVQRDGAPVEEGEIVCIAHRLD